MPETTELMKRPSKSDCIVKRRAWELFMPSVKRYLGSEWSESEAPHIEKQMIDILDEFSDGYGMARELERKGWEEDRGLVDLMDEGEYFLTVAHGELLKQWVKCYGISPDRSVGDEVMAEIYNRRGQVGVISTIYLDEAKYGVRYPEQDNTSHYLVEYENVKDVPGVSNANIIQRVG